MTVSNSPVTIHIIAGPTAGGKSARALELARRMNGVIINCDSLQIYDGLRTLTAHPSAEDLQSAPHELYGVLYPSETCSAGSWRAMVEPLITKTLADGKTPIVCGGTGLYIKALIDGLSPIPDIPEDIRTRSITMQKDMDAPSLFTLLQDRDPIMAARLDPNNRARIIRALEVIEATGKSLAECQAEDRLAPPDHWQFEIHKMIPEREELHRRCNDRFDKMLAAGALEEVKAFAQKIDDGEIGEDAPLTRALGFKPLRSFLRGEISREDAIERAQTDTRQYAKRQVTWFRNQL